MYKIHHGLLLIDEIPNTIIPLHSGRIVRAPHRFMFLGKAHENILEELESDPMAYDEAINDVEADH